MVAPFPPPVTKLFLRVPLSHLQKVACQIAERTQFPFVQHNSTAKVFFCKDEAQCSHICFMHGVWNKSCFQFCLKSVPRPWSSRNDLIHLTTSITKIEKICLMKRCKTVEPSDQNYLHKINDNWTELRSMNKGEHQTELITLSGIWFPRSPQQITSCVVFDDIICIL